MRIPIQCLMVTGGALDDGLRTALYLAALRLIRNHEEYTKFLDENGAGGVSTKHRRRCISSYMAGIEFDATVEYGDKTIRCRFLVDDTNMPTEEEVIASELNWIPIRFSSDVEEGEEWKKG